MDNKPFVVSLIAAVLVGGLLGGIFAGGVVYGKSLSQTGVLAGGAVTAGPESPAAVMPTAAAGSGTAAAGGQRQRVPGGQTGITGLGGQGGFGGGLSGTVEKIEGGVVTITTAQGSLQATLDANTTFAKVATSSGTLADLQPGVTVQVAGASAPDGSVIARTVIITTGVMPNFRPGGTGGQTRPGAAPQASNTPPSG